MKKITKVLLASALIAPCMAFAGCDTTKTNVESAQETQTTQSVEDKKMAVYQLAVEAGYEGTYEDWLASIKGEKGDPGIQGEKGDPGKDGREIELRVYNGVIQWHYVGEETWKDLQETNQLSESVLFNKFKIAAKNTAEYRDTFSFTGINQADGSQYVGYNKQDGKGYVMSVDGSGTYLLADDNKTKVYFAYNENKTYKVEDIPLEDFFYEPSTLGVFDPKNLLFTFGYNDDFYTQLSDLSLNKEELCSNWFNAATEVLEIELSNFSINFQMVDDKYVCVMTASHSEGAPHSEGTYTFKYIFTDEYIVKVHVFIDYAEDVDMDDSSFIYEVSYGTFDDTKMATDLDTYYGPDAYEKGLAGLYDSNNQIVKTWDELVTQYPSAFDGTTIVKNNNTQAPFSYFVNLSGKLIIGSSITEIGQFAFYDCIALTEIVIPESVEVIGSSAFDGCTGVEVVVIDSQEIANNIFIPASAQNYATPQAYAVGGLCAGVYVNNGVVYIKSGLITTNSTYLTENFTKQSTSDREGYDKWVSNH